ncbi:hypothetical protein QQZ08_001361 [Neonectria magnoliae]|uniref:Uncharacterized protein n=1 Tax=Neonectria magnoliae TaxID=2732573 RepID=A0ABR1IEK6_9HYPO
MSSSLVNTTFPPHLFSWEARLLLKRSSLTQCMSFIINIGYSPCTEHCCRPPTSEPRRETFGPNIDPALTQEAVGSATKLQQWDLVEGRVSQDVGNEGHRFYRLISHFSQSDMTMDMTRPGDEWEKRPDIDYRDVPTERLLYFIEYDRQQRDPTVTGRSLELKVKRDVINAHFENNLFFKLPAAWFADNVFWSRPTDGYDELSKMYMAWRKLWYVYVFRTDYQATGVSTRLENIEDITLPILSQLKMWGNLQNDYNLYHFQELSRVDLRYTYEHEPEGIFHMLSNLAEWKEECQIINDYVGLRRDMSKHQFHAARRAAQRAGSAMDHVARAEKDGYDHLSKIQVMYTAKLRYLELRAILCLCPIPGGLEAEVIANMQRDAQADTV